MDSYKLPLYLCMLIGGLVFGIMRLRISTRIAIYLTIVVAGYLWSGLLKFNANISDMKDLLPYFGVLFFLAVVTTIHDVWFQKDNNLSQKTMGKLTKDEELFRSKLPIIPGHPKFRENEKCDLSKEDNLCDFCGVLPKSNHSNYCKACKHENLS